MQSAFAVLSILSLLLLTTHSLLVQSELELEEEVDKRAFMGPSYPSDQFVEAVRSVAPPQQNALQNLLFKWMEKIDEDVADPEYVRRQILARKFWK